MCIRDRAIPLDLRPGIGNLIFGCDICQEVCPWNSKSKPTTVEAFRPRQGNLLPKLDSLLKMTQVEFNQRFKDSPIKRAKRRGFLRNVAVAMGNARDPDTVPVLSQAIADEEPLVRQHAAWALGQINNCQAKDVLMHRLPIEEDSVVKAEIESAL